MDHLVRCDGCGKLIPSDEADDVSDLDPACQWALACERCAGLLIADLEANEEDYDA